MRVLAGALALQIAMAAARLNGWRKFERLRREAWYYP
jgi:hypothetical protein